MKKKLKCILTIISVFVFSSCSLSDYRFKNMDEMNILELNEYNKSLSRENSKLKDEYSDLLDTSGGKNKEEIMEMINYLNNEIVKSNVMITNESKTFFHTTSISSGSGTIIKEDDNNYYVLTNNHVIYSLGNRSSYYVYDYLNNEYRATLMFHDANYDMALLKFNKGNANLRVMKFASENSKENDNVIAIGQPLGQRNAINFGEVLKYEKINCQGCAIDESNINYECMFYSAKTTNGNSGGMIINYNYELVGVVTYGVSTTTGQYIYGAGSPIEKVKEFLNNNYFEVGDTNV